MRELAKALAEYVESRFSERLSQSLETRFQPVLVGPPSSALREVYQLLTRGGKTDWNPEWSELREGVPVLLISDRVDAERASQGVSAVCSWDYAVNIRDSRRMCLSLCPPEKWNDRLVSVANATDTIGVVRIRDRARFCQEPLWGWLAEKAGGTQARTVLELTARGVWDLGGGEREEIVWSVLERLLRARGARDLLVAAGLPFVDSEPLDVSEIRASQRTLTSLARQMGKRGFEDGQGALLAGVEELKRQGELPSGVVGAIGQMIDHLQAQATTAAQFADNPQQYFRPECSETDWWLSLDYGRLGDILGYIGWQPPSASLSLNVVNSLNDEEPWIVRDLVELRATTREGSVEDDSLKFRWRTSGRYEPLEEHVSDGSVVHRTPVHEVPVTYQVDGPDLKSDRAKVIALGTFVSGGYAEIAEASSVSPPKKNDNGRIVQKIVLEEPGVHSIRLYVRSDVRKIQLLSEEGVELGHEVASSADDVIECSLALENGAELGVHLYDADGDSVSTWVVEIEVEEPDGDLPTSRFQALVEANKRSQPDDSIRVQADERRVRTELESAYLETSCSWRGVLAGWARPARAVWKPDWDSARIGDLEFGVDPRPNNRVPPDDVIAARERLREILESEGSVAQADLTAGDIPEAAEEYLSAYMRWLDDKPAEAAWQDIIALFGREQSSYSDRPPPTAEPVAILLSPLHPLRLVWHVHAHQQLTEALRSRPCPAAGLVDPFAAPGLFHLPCHETGQVRWHSYVRAGLNDVHWALLWHAGSLGDSAVRGDIESALEQLGLTSTSLSRGISSAHAERALSEVQRILPARANLRVGIVGGGAEASAVIEGLMRWCRQVFDAAGRSCGSLHACEVYDSRGTTVEPSAAELQLLKADTGENVQWFRETADSSTHLDLYLLNDVLTRSWKLTKPRGEHPPRSPMSRGGLIRIDIREDFVEAKILQQSCRAMAPDPASDGLGSAVLRCQARMEELDPDQIDNPSVLEFRPDQEAISTRLPRSNFLAATSGEIDPACFARGIQGTEGYLWDYELPDVAAVDDDRVGYYLIGGLSQPLRDSVQRAAGLITTDQEIDPDKLLMEISRCGIPILRRFALGGAAARGELGLLLAIRLLQDVFGSAAHNPRLPVWWDAGANLILPVDSYWPTLKPFGEAIDAQVTGEHPDLVVFSIQTKGEVGTRIVVTPIEVKFRNSRMLDQDVRKALGQAANLGELLSAMWSDAPPNRLWRTCTHALLARYLDQTFRVYADPRIHGTSQADWTRLHQRVVGDVLREHAEIKVVREGRVLAFDGSDSSRKADIDDRGNALAVAISRRDAASLLFRSGDVSDVIDSAIQGMGLYGLAGGNRGWESDGDRWHSSTSGSEVGPGRPGAGERLEGEETGTQGSDDGQGVPQEIRERVRSSFRGFVGNRSAVRRLENDILRAYLEEEPHLTKNILLTGLPSTGKTELSRRVAGAMELPFVSLDGPALTSRSRLFELVTKTLERHGLEPERGGSESGLPVFEYPPILIFVDEVHLVTRSVQESLLKVLESSDRRLLLQDEVADLHKATFVFATTRASGLDPAFRSRCVEIALREYELEEVAEIIRRRFPHEDWPDEVYLRIAKLGRLVPRVALEVAKDLETTVKVSDTPERSIQEHLDEVKDLREIDERGLTRLDREYMSALESEGRPVGEKALLSLMGVVDKERIVSEVEPFLRRLDFVRLSPNGRGLTASGRRYLRQSREGSL